MMMNVIKVKQDGEVWMERRIINFCNITLAREHIAIATLKALRHMLTTELTSIFRAVQPVHIMYNVSCMISDTKWKSLNVVTLLVKDQFSVIPLFGNSKICSPFICT